MARAPKTLTQAQLHSRKDKAVRFVRDVLGDEDRADEIEAESLEDYAQRRHIKLSNPVRRVTTMPRKTLVEYREENKALRDQIRELEEEKEDLEDRLEQVADIALPEEDEEDEDDEDQGETGDEGEEEDEDGDGD